VKTITTQKKLDAQRNQLVLMGQKDDHRPKHKDGFSLSQAFISKYLFYCVSAELIESTERRVINKQKIESEQANTKRGGKNLLSPSRQLHEGLHMRRTCIIWRTAC